MEKEDSILFIDAEFVDNQEMIELSVWNLEGREVYHRFFKPAEIKEWPVSEAVHHISPADVRHCASFAKCRPEIQSVFDRAEYIVGFATKGDIAHLSKSGIKGLDKKKVIDIKQMFWLYIGQDRDYDYYGIPGLSRVSEMLGVEFGEKGAHSASEDTLVTLKCFNALASMIPDNPYAEPTEEAFKKAVSQFEQEFSLAKDAYERKKAHGWIHIMKGAGGVFKLLFKRKEPEDSPQLVGKIEVGDISKAEADIMARFQRKMLQGNRSLFRLSRNDLKSLLAYTNEYGDEEEHSLNKKLVQLQKMFR